MLTEIYKLYELRKADALLPIQCIHLLAVTACVLLCAWLKKLSCLPYKFVLHAGIMDKAFISISFVLNISAGAVRISALMKNCQQI